VLVVHKTRAKCVLAAVTVEGAANSEMADLIKEMEIMKNIGQHTNLRGLLGCCTQNGNSWLFSSVT